MDYGSRGGESTAKVARGDPIRSLGRLRAAFLFWRYSRKGNDGADSRILATHYLDAFGGSSMTKVRPIFDKCFARSRGGCTHKSQEHYISESILELLGPGKLSVHNPAWLDNGAPPQTMTAANISAGVLCEEHNSKLSILDSEALCVMRHLKNLDSAGRSEREMLALPEIVSVDGTKLERWLLKAYCGVTASGNFKVEGKRIGKMAPHPTILDLLFSTSPWIGGVGLYVNFDATNRLTVERGVWFDVVTAKTTTDGGRHTHAQICGFDFKFWGFPFRILLATYQPGIPALPNYRPQHLRVVVGKVMRELRFEWPADSLTSPGFTLNRNGTTRDDGSIEALTPRA
jgi:hypothetical protein